MHRIIRFEGSFMVFEVFESNDVYEDFWWLSEILFHRLSVFMIVRHCSCGG